MQCDDGDVRLLTGVMNGPLEVCVSKRWASVCFEGGSDVDAAVACRQLGYASGEINIIHYSLRYVNKINDDGKH